MNDIKILAQSVSHISSVIFISNLDSSTFGTLNLVKSVLVGNMGDFLKYNFNK